jgi:hypothetical protein
VVKAQKKRFVQFETFDIMLKLNLIDFKNQNREQKFLMTQNGVEIQDGSRKPFSSLGRCSRKHTIY